MPQQPPDIPGELLGAAVMGAQLLLQPGPDQREVNGVGGILWEENSQLEWIPPWIPKQPGAMGLTVELERRWKGRQGSWHSSCSSTDSHF